MITPAPGTFVFTNLHAARRMLRGFCVPRVIVRVARGRWIIVHPTTARRHGWSVVS